VSLPYYSSRLLYCASRTAPTDTYGSIVSATPSRTTYITIYHNYMYPERQACSTAWTIQIFRTSRTNTHRSSNLMDRYPHRRQRSPTLGIPTHTTQRLHCLAGGVLDSRSLYQTFPVSIHMANPYRFGHGERPRGTPYSTCHPHSQEPPSPPSRCISPLLRRCWHPLRARSCCVPSFPCRLPRS